MITRYGMNLELWNAGFCVIIMCELMLTENLAFWWIFCSLRSEWMNVFYLADVETWLDADAMRELDYRRGIFNL